MPSMTDGQRRAFADVQSRLKYTDARMLDALAYLIARDRGWHRKCAVMSAQTMLDCVELGWLDSHGGISTAGRAALRTAARGLFLVVSEGAWWSVDAHLPPSGAYGVDWCVMRAISGPDALRQAPSSVTGQLPVSGDDDAECLSEQDARDAFTREKDARDAFMREV